MVQALPSRQSPASLTLADVIRAIDSNTALSPWRRRDLLSAIRSICRLLDAAPGMLPADPQALRRRLDAVSPALRGSRWANIRSLTLAALREAGIAVMAGRSREPLSAAWAELKAKLEGPRLRYGLCRFISFCSRHNIAPEQVDRTTFARFDAALATESFVKAPGEVYRNACLFWNRASKTITGWPELTVEIPVRGRRYAVGWRELPESFRADTEAYLNRMGSPDILAADYVRSASPRTVELRRHQIKVLATALIRSGVPADGITGLEILVKPENAWQAMRFFVDRTGGKKTTANHELARLLGTIGRHWVKLPEADQLSLDDLAQRLAVSQTGMTDKNRARLRQFYAATSARERIVFHLLNPKTHHRIQMRSVDAETGEEVPRDELLKGYEFDKNRYVVVEKEELDELKIESSQTIDLERLVDTKDIDPIYLNAPYYLAPEGKIADETFRVIHQALRNKKMAGVGHLVLSTREHAVIAMPRDCGMLLSTLRPADEVRGEKEYFEEIETGPLDKEMVQLAERMIEQKAGKFYPEQLIEDRYQTALRDLIQRKIKGQNPVVAKAPAGPAM